jgi:hypothetical protein
VDRWLGCFVCSVSEKRSANARALW